MSSILDCNYRYCDFFELDSSFNVFYRVIAFQTSPNQCILTIYFLCCISSTLLLRRYFDFSYRSFPTLLQLLNSTHLTTFFQDVDVIRIVSRHVRIVTAVGKSNRQTARQGYRRVVFLVVETISQRPALVRSNREKVVSHLLPALASVFDGIETLTDAAASRNGTLKIKN